MSEHRSAAPVLVGVDGSAGSLAAVELGAWEARRHRVPLHLVYGYQGETPHLTYGMGPMDSLTQWWRDEAKSMLTDIELATRSTHPGLTVHSTVVAGGGAGALVELSRGASLVVVGSRGRGGFADLLVGSVAVQVAMHAHAPVVVMRPPVADATEAVAAARLGPAAGPVIVGLDGSAGSAQALGFAIEEAAARRTPLVASYVWFAEPMDNLPGGEPYDRARAEAHADRMIAEAVAGWAEKYPDVVIDRKPLHHMNPTWSLIELSRTASLLVVGTRGRGGFASLLLGSVSRGLVGHAECPVVVVRAAS